MIPHIDRKTAKFWKNGFIGAINRWISYIKENIIFFLGKVLTLCQGSYSYILVTLTSQQKNKEKKKMTIENLMNYRPIRRIVKEHGMVKAKELIKEPNFPIWVCLKMEQFGLSQRELANRMSMDESLLSRLLSEQRKPNVDHIKALAYVFEVEISEIWELI